MIQIGYPTLITKPMKQVFGENNFWKRNTNDILKQNPSSSLSALVESSPLSSSSSSLIKTTTHSETYLQSLH